MHTGRRRKFFRVGKLGDWVYIFCVFSRDLFSNQILYLIANRHCKDKEQIARLTRITWTQTFSPLWHSSVRMSLWSLSTFKLNNRWKTGTKVRREKRTFLVKRNIWKEDMGMEVNRLGWFTISQNPTTNLKINWVMAKAWHILYWTFVQTWNPSKSHHQQNFINSLTNVLSPDI